MAPLTFALAGARLRAAGARQVAVVVALALAAVIPVVVAASASVTASAALGRALSALPAGDRSVIVSFNGLLDAAESASADRSVRSRLAELGTSGIRRQLEYRQLADSAGQTFTLAAADDLRSAVRLVDGRLPRSCTPQRCEVVVERPPGTPEPVLRAGYGLVVVGHVVRTDPLLLTGTFDPGSDVPLVLADGVDRAAAIAPLALILRSFGWVAPLDASVIGAEGVAAWSRTATDVANKLFLDLTGLELITPDASLRVQESRAQDSARRFGLLAGSCAALLLGAALVGGAALRPDQTRFVAALRRRGLGAGRIRAVVCAETLVLAVAGAGLGLLAGFGAAALMAANSALPVASTARTAVLDALPGVLGLTAAAWALLVLSLWPSTSRPGYVQARAAWRALAVAALAGLLAVLLVISRGSAGAGSRSDPLVVVLPALVLLTLGLATARLWPFAVRLAYRLLPRRAAGLRLGVAGISARPMLAAATVALLAAGVGATGFAASYRSTLLRGASDQAAFTVPFDGRVVTGSGLQPVLSLASVAQYAAVVPGARATAVLRQAGSIRSGPGSSQVVQLVGLDPAELVRVRRWSRVVGGPAPADVAAALRVPAAGLGVTLPAGKRLEVQLDDALPGVELFASLRAADGTEASVQLQPGSSDRTALSAQIPAPPVGAGRWQLGALSLRQSAQDAARREHGQGEGSTSRAVPSGTIVLQGVKVDAATVPAPWSGWSGPGLRVDPGGARAVFAFRLTAGLLVLSATPPGPGAAASGQPLPVAADPVTAAQGPLITITLNGSPVRARVVATLPRMSTVTGRFVVTDRRALSALVDAGQPGQGQPGEIWLDLPAAAGAAGPAGSAGSGPSAGSAESRAVTALATRPFTGVTATWADRIERSLRTDPVARGAVQLLVLSAGLTMLVALAALILLVASERYEDAGELYSWEADGVVPAVLRRGLWVRAALVAVVAVPAGVLGGLVLTRLTARLVGVTAGAEQPQPPLVAVTGIGTALPAIVIGLVLALATAALVAAGALREPRPVPPTSRRGV